jgi:hypothetical protein
MEGFVYYFIWVKLGRLISLPTRVCCREGSEIQGSHPPGASEASSVTQKESNPKRQSTSLLLGHSMLTPGSPCLSLWLWLGSYKSSSHGDIGRLLNYDLFFPKEMHKEYLPMNVASLASFFSNDDYVVVGVEGSQNHPWWFFKLQECCPCALDIYHILSLPQILFKVEILGRSSYKIFSMPTA